MKKVGELMEEMGFRKEASEATKKAFFKHLVISAEKVKTLPVREMREKNESQTPPIVEEQLSFAFIDERSAG